MLRTTSHRSHNCASCIQLLLFTHELCEFYRPHTLVSCSRCLLFPLLRLFLSIGPHQLDRNNLGPCLPQTKLCFASSCRYVDVDLLVPNFEPTLNPGLVFGKLWFGVRVWPTYTKKKCWPNMVANHTNSTQGSPKIQTYYKNNPNWTQGPVCALDPRGPTEPSGAYGLGCGHAGMIP